jgi:hypothetical protein
VRTEPKEYLDTVIRQGPVLSASHPVIGHSGASLGGRGSSEGPGALGVWPRVCPGS